MQATFNKYKMDFKLKIETKLFHIFPIHNKLKVYNKKIIER